LHYRPPIDWNSLAAFLGIDRNRVRVFNADVGGAFGAKNYFLGEEIIAALLAVKFARPVKWIEQRSENLQAQSQGRGQVNYVEAAYQNDGRLLGLRVRLLADLGAFLTFLTPMMPMRVPSMLCGPYQVQAVESHVLGMFTNKATTAPYRGAGRPEATYILERVIDRIALKLGLDPAEVRRRNFIPPQATPYKTVTGIVNWPTTKAGEQNNRNIVKPLTRDYWVLAWRLLSNCRVIASRPRPTCRVKPPLRGFAAMAAY
jgi:carbon-monoxide dehydrogenase large subunit